MTRNENVTSTWPREQGHMPWTKGHKDFKFETSWRKVRNAAIRKNRLSIRVAPFCKFCRKVLLHTTFLEHFDALISKMSSDSRNSQKFWGSGALKNLERFLNWWSTMHCAERIATDTQSARFNTNLIDKLQSGIKTMKQAQLKRTQYCFVFEKVIVEPTVPPPRQLLVTRLLARWLHCCNGYQSGFINIFYCKNGWNHILWEFVKSGDLSCIFIGEC